ncbi:uncharacterized protein LOC111338671 [Stylophora pistillata]|uniref:uncharacterized protein LOC111338671 n=1 Tax=Stylophora pistillata TaxID=50429 RepID=UPI000C04B7FF|nr:uncharacterized protein LOC111338671 [Stylophora pistillata]
MEEESIALESCSGWHGARPIHSLKSLEWLLWEERQRIIHIRHARNGGEMSIRLAGHTHHVDGYDEQSRTCFEFQGCLFHGFRTCFPDRKQVPHSAMGLTVGALLRRTQQKLKALRDAGYTVIEMWKCKFDALKKQDEECRNFVTNLNLVSPLEPRDAFFGGRTGAVALHHRVSDSEQIRYVDVTSEYPWVNKNGLYPLGHPVILYELENQDPSVYYGLLKVDVLPPAELFHPFLPYRRKMSSGSYKFTFPLCAKWVEVESVKPMLARSFTCSHTDTERCLRGTWCSPDLNKAIALGYRVLRIHELWHFRSKQESAGYPAWCENETDRARYVQDYHQKEGIELDPSKIAKNPGQKAVAKLMLNSFWGKSGQQTNKSGTTQLSEARDLLDLLDDPLVNVQDIRNLSPEIVEVVTQRDASDRVKGMTTNIFIAAFTTAMARLKLYESLETVQQQVLYYDTDSVVYRWKLGDPEIPLGDHLGEMTNELDDGDYIQEFISAGAKNYGYRTHLGHVSTKVKGFSLNVRGKKQLNFQVLKNNVLEELIERGHVVTQIHNPVHFVRDPVAKRIRTEQQTKSYRLVFDKRVLGEGKSFPYGYQICT